MPRALSLHSPIHLVAAFGAELPRGLCSSSHLVPEAPATTSNLASRLPRAESTKLRSTLIGYPSHTHTGRHPLSQVQVELKKGQSIMVDANLQQPSGALHRDVSIRSGLPADTFELYHGSKRLEGEAVLASWGVEKDLLIEVKTRGRGGMHGGGGSRGGAD
eukprot:scaffold40368_cov59-Phaeocystis_antarctica.AAC.1